MKKSFLLFSLLCVALLQAEATLINSTTDANGYPRIIPEVQKLTPQPKQLKILKPFTVTAPPELNLIPLEKTLRQKGIALKSASQGTCQFIITTQNVPKDSEGYTLSITPKNILVKSRSQQGLFWGLQSLRWIFRNTEGNTLKCCEIVDFPDQKMRAPFLECNYMSPIKVEKLVEAFDIYAQFKYNTLVIDFGHKFPINGAPLPGAKNPFSEKDIATIKAAADANHLDIIPFIQCISHAWWMICHPKFNSEYSEGKARNAWVSTYCLSNPEATQLALDYVKSHLKLLKPHYCHLGLDELHLGLVGVCDKCKTQDTYDLYMNHVRDLFKACREAGTIPMIFDDQFRKTYLNLTPKYMPKVLENLDRDIAINIWDYRTEPTSEIRDGFTEKGYKNFCYMSYSDHVENTVALPQFSHKHGDMGVILAWWQQMAPTLEYARGKRGNAYAALVLGASYSWKTNQCYYRDHTYDPVLEFHRIAAPQDLLSQQTMKATSVPLDSAFNTQLGQSTLFPQFTASQLKELQKELASASERFHLAIHNENYMAITLSGSEYDTFARTPVLIPFNAQAKALNFLLTAAPWNDTTRSRKSNLIGSHILITYTNGKKVTIKLQEHINLVPWTQDSSTYDARFQCIGRDKNNARFNFSSLLWKNPTPQIPIQSIAFVPQPQADFITSILALTAYDASTEFTSQPDATIAAKIPVNNGYSDTDDFIPILDLTKPLDKKIFRNATTSKQFKEPLQFNVVTNEKEPYLEISIPPVKNLDKPARVTLDFPIDQPNPDFKAFVIDRQFSHPDGIQRADAYFIQLVAKEGNRANAFINYDRNVPKDSLRHLISFVSDKYYEAEGGGITNFSDGTLHVRIGFFVKNTEPMTIRLYKIGSTKLLRPFVTKAYK